MPIRSLSEIWLEFSQSAVSRRPPTAAVMRSPTGAAPLTIRFAIAGVFDHSGYAAMSTMP